MNLRIKILAITFLVSSVALIGRLFYWQVIRGDWLAIQAKSQHVSGLQTLAKRGSILDRNGEYLTASVDSWLLFANLKRFNQSPQKIANLLSEILTLNPEDTDEKYKELLLGNAIKYENALKREGVVWSPLENKININQKEEIESLDIEGLGFELEESRVYPESSSSAHLLGFLGKNETGDDVGYFGLEGYYDLTLSATSGFLKRESDAGGAPILIGDSKEILASGGVDLLTHIDKRIQLTIEKHLKEGLETYGAVSGTTIVMEPSTGAVLGMASYPSYDPEKYFEYSDELFKNPSISDAFEPGSIFKPIVMASALDAGAVEPDTRCDICDKPLKVDKYFIKTWNNEYHPNSTMVDVIKHSDNVGMAFVGQKLGADKLHDYISDFGFGQLTGIDLQGEASPSIREKGKWNIVDLATTTFGQSIAVTPIQMIASIATIANDGQAYKPQVVDKIVQGEWSQDIKPEFRKRVISEKAANQITSMMITAVKDGEAKWAVPKGFKIAGKTGTAQIPVAGHYDDEKTIASFVGFAPADNPKFVMLVTLREPQTSPWASETAAPLWFDIATDLFPYLGVQPDN